MIYFFMLAVLVGLIGMGVLVLYLMDRVHKIENKSVGGGGTGEAFGTSDPHFEGLGGQRLWAVLTASEGAVANSAIARNKHLYAQVLQRHIEELFEEGRLDGRQGVRMLPAPVRLIKTLGGQVASWLPPADSREIYEIGLERSVSSGSGFSALRTRLERVCARLYEKVGIDLMPQLFDHLLPGSGNGSGNPVVQALGLPAVDGVAADAEEPPDGNATIVEVIQKSN